MKWIELLKAMSSSGDFPEVEVSITPKFATSNRGKVTVIKSNGRHSGVGVLFPGLNYDIWFHNSDDTDKRSRYIRDLILVVPLQSVSKQEDKCGCSKKYFCQEHDFDHKPHSCKCGDGKRTSFNMCCPVHGDGKDYLDLIKSKRK